MYKQTPLNCTHMHTHTIYSQCKTSCKYPERRGQEEEIKYGRLILYDNTIIPLQPLTDEQKKELREAFNKFDIDKDGSITVTELKEVLMKMGIEKTDLEIADLIDKADKDGSGTIDFDEYCQQYIEIDEKRMLDLFKVSIRLLSSMYNIYN